MLESNFIPATIQIHVEHIGVMKMILTSTIEISLPTTLTKVKQQVFESFWADFNRYFPERVAIHGSAKDVSILVNRNRESPINDDDELQQKIQTTHNFQAIFSSGTHGQ